MSRERLQLLRERLAQSGWSILPFDGGDACFLMRDNRIQWQITSQTTAKTMELKLFAVAGLGGPAKIQDILYCEVVETGQRMYFGKQNSKRWRADLELFVSELGK